VNTHEYRGVKFEIDDSKGCYLETTYKDVTGYVGVSLSGTNDTRYAWVVQSSRVTEEGLTRGSSAGNTMQPNLHALCDWILEEVARREATRAFTPEAPANRLAPSFTTS
jgi:hypothetical protein